MYKKGGGANVQKGFNRGGGTPGPKSATALFDKEIIHQVSTFKTIALMRDVVCGNTT